MCGQLAAPLKVVDLRKVALKGRFSLFGWTQSMLNFAPTLSSFTGLGQIMPKSSDPVKKISFFVIGNKVRMKHPICVNFY